MNTTTTSESTNFPLGKRMAVREIDVPDLMASQTSCLLDDSVSTTWNNPRHNRSLNASYYESCNGSLAVGDMDASYLSCRSRLEHSSDHVEPLALGVIDRNREAFDALVTPIQAVARGFLVRWRILSAPLLERLKDLETQKHEELVNIELYKHTQMQQLQKEMETSLSPIGIVHFLKKEVKALEKENKQWKKDCKELKKHNGAVMAQAECNNMPKRLQKMKDHVATLKAQVAESKTSAAKCLETMDRTRRMIREHEQKQEAVLNGMHKYKKCIDDIIQKSAFGGERLALDLRQITKNSPVFRAQRRR